MRGSGLERKCDDDGIELHKKIKFTEVESRVSRNKIAHSCSFLLKTFAKMVS